MESISLRSSVNRRKSLLPITSLQYISLFKEKLLTIKILYVTSLIRVLLRKYHSLLLKSGNKGNTAAMDLKFPLNSLKFLRKELSKELIIEL